MAAKIYFMLCISRHTFWICYVYIDKVFQKYSLYADRDSTFFLIIL